MSISKLPALFVLSGLAGAAAHAAPVPSPEVARTQLRALNHRFIHAAIDTSGDLIGAVAHEDFPLTQSDGTWRRRDEFLALVGQPHAPDGALDDDTQVRLFGRVALVHGVFSAPGPAGRERL